VFIAFVVLFVLLLRGAIVWRSAWWTEAGPAVPAARDCCTWSGRTRHSSLDGDPFGVLTAVNACAAFACPRRYGGHARLRLLRLRQLRLSQLHTSICDAVLNQQLRRKRIRW
jgi:hypothetical protein